MKVNIEMENLTELVTASITKSANEVMQKVIESIVKDYLEENFKNKIDDLINEKVSEYFKEYLTTATVTVGGGFYSNEEVKTYKVEEYVKKVLADDLKNKTLSVKEKDRYGDTKVKKVSFEEYVLNNVGANELIKPKLDRFVKETRDTINQNVKTMFDNTTKEMLSNTVLNVLMCNDTYKKIESTMKGIANGKE